LLVTGLSLESANRVQKEVPFQSGQTISINLKSGGSIHVSGWDKNNLSIDVHITNGKSDDWDVDIDKLSSGFGIETRYIGDNHRNQGGSNIELRVPRKTSLKLRTMGGGITLESIEGDFTGKTMGGKLILSHLKGFINLKTMGGQIMLTDSDIDGKVKTMGGRVLLENVMGDVSGSTMGGNVIYKNVKSRSGKSTGDVLLISTMGGDINVSEAKHGTKVSTMGGDIRIKSAKEFIKAKTMGGRINVDSIDGWIDAITMGGNVSVTMTGDPQKGKRDVKLTSMGGDISLSVPGGLSMDVDIKLAYTKSSKQNYKIISDFDLKRERSKEWDKKEGGSPKKSIYGKGQINGGKHKITIKTVNGNVYLKKN
ncbi:MAG: DUF4097 domain-containing protein, partial [bacterium]|nr:DUF4097 domain-containing protein [bacterium]